MYIGRDFFKRKSLIILVMWCQHKASQDYHVAVISQLHLLHDVLTAVVADHALQVRLLDVLQQLVCFIRELHG